MPRNLDLTALRSFVTVAETGGVTRAAGFLNLTQSAVSMQLKRLEEALDVQLLDRSSRALSLTAEGEQLLGYAKRMVELNDEAWGRLTSGEYEGVITLGVPHDIVYPALPQVLARFAAEYPRVTVQLVSSYTRHLRRAFKSGECEIILTTEFDTDPGGESLTELPLIWVAAPEAKIWRNRPLRVAFGQQCGFRPVGLRALERAGIPWEMVIDSNSDRAIEATISADLAIGAMLDRTLPEQLVPLAHGGALPDLGAQKINLYYESTGAPCDALVEYLRQSYRMIKPVSLSAA
jgi:DNA-binding transcriptional LysR family regulator